MPLLQFFLGSCQGSRRLDGGRHVWVASMSFLSAYITPLRHLISCPAPLRLYTAHPPCTTTLVCCCFAPSPKVCCVFRPFYSGFGTFGVRHLTFCTFGVTTFPPVTQRGKNPGAFISLFTYFCPRPPSAGRCVPSFLSREGSSRPFLSSTAVLKSKFGALHTYIVSYDVFAEKYVRPAVQGGVHIIATCF